MGSVIGHGITGITRMRLCALPVCTLLLMCGNAWSMQAPAAAGDAPRPLGYANPQAAATGVVPVTVALAREGNALVAHFSVTTAAIYARPQLAHDEYPYQYDVVEVFVRNARSGRKGYFEFELSPYDQSLQVNVIEPRQQYCFGIQNGFTHAARITPTGWEADLRIPLATLGWRRGQALELLGNAYAALGEGEQRVYWSLFELPPGKPDFHVPSAFRPLL